jgi:thioredoxin-related protein
MIKIVWIAVGLFSSMVSERAESSTKADSLTSGVHFVTGLSWKQVLEKAKNERKYIFVDCYATWCEPCKRMDQEVYSRQDVADDFNGKFISVRVQLDTSKTDNEATRAFYADAHYIGTHYDIRLYPTLLFFNSNGNILSKVSGGLDASGFIKLGGEVLDSAKDYYSLLARYDSGERDLQKMSYLARTAISLLQDTVQSETIAKEYMLFIKEKDMFSVTNIEFAREFTHHTWDPGFAFFYGNSDSIDRIMRAENYAEEFVHGRIFADFVRPEFSKCKKLKTTPDWSEIASTIATKYNQYYTDRVVLGSKADWAASQGDFLEHTKNLVLFLNKYGPKTDSGGEFEALYFNNCAWDVFEHSSNLLELNNALHWTARAIMMDPKPDWMDTYANILYKIGRKADALKWEEVAVKLAPNYEPILSDYESMKAGKPTWLSN